MARWVTRFHLSTQATGFLGGSIGIEREALLDDEGVRHNFIEVKGNTRVSITVSNRKTHQKIRLSFPGPKIAALEIAELKKKIFGLGRKSLLVIGGSFPPGFLTSHLNGIIRIAEKRGIPVIVDVPGYLLKRVRRKNLWLIKPNLTEFHEFTEANTTRISSLVAEARDLAPGVRLVCITSVNGGALLISRQSVWFGKTPKQKVKSTVGAGNSMVATMAAV